MLNVASGQIWDQSPCLPLSHLVCLHTIHTRMALAHASQLSLEQQQALQQVFLICSAVIHGMCHMLECWLWICVGFVLSVSQSLKFYQMPRQITDLVCFACRIHDPHSGGLGSCWPSSIGAATCRAADLLAASASAEHQCRHLDSACGQVTAHSDWLRR